MLGFSRRYSSAEMIDRLQQLDHFFFSVGTEGAGPIEGDSLEMLGRKVAEVVDLWLVSLCVKEGSIGRYGAKSVGLLNLCFNCDRV